MLQYFIVEQTFLIIYISHQSNRQYKHGQILTQTQVFMSNSATGKF